MVNYERILLISSEDDETHYPTIVDSHLRQIIKNR